MKLFLPILTVILIANCASRKNESNILSRCETTKTDYNEWILISDSLNYFSYYIPDSSWHPDRFFNENENGLTVGDTTGGYLKFFNVNQTNYTYAWNWQEELINVENDFNVIEKGFIPYKGQNRPFHIVKFDENKPELVTLYVTVLDTTKQRNYTVALSTEMAENYQNRICELKPVMDSFQIH